MPDWVPYVVAMVVIVGGIVAINAWLTAGALKR